MKKALKWIFLALIILFIYAPIVLLTVYSFNASEMITTGWLGFSWEHYQYFFNPNNQPLPIVFQTICLALNT